MTAIGVDIGGTKIEVQVFGDDWAVLDRRRVATPSDYPALVGAVAKQVSWADEVAGQAVPVGIGSAGLIHPHTGRMIAANLAAHEQAFVDDLTHAIGRTFLFLNDCRALALSEAVFGAAQGHRCVLALILGTGVSGGLIIEGAVHSGPSGTGGEIGHMAAPAHVVEQYDLPIWDCGCGRRGCLETYVSGPGLVRLAQHVTGQVVSAPDIAVRRDGDMAQVWAMWCALVGDMIQGLTVTVDPDVVVLGGGLSKIDGVAQDLQKATAQAQFADFAVPPVVVAQGGDSSGARGAAFAAWRAAQ